MRRALVPSAADRADSAPKGGAWPLAVSANGRHLVDAQARPFFPIIDTAWCAITQLSTAQMDAYLEDCAARGFNGTIVEAMENTFSDNPPNTFDGIAPLTTVNDFSTPNEAYFARLDHFVAKAKSLGIAVYLWPLYVGLQPGGSQGWSSQFEGNTQAKRQGWGTFIGNRYKGYGNVVLVHGGDGTVPDFGPINDYINALIAVWPNALHSYHAQRTVSAYTAANGQSWLNLNNSYIDNSDAGLAALTEYNRTPVRPVFLIENYYEAADSSNASGVLNELWQSLCSGCLAGIAYGSEGIWTFGGPGYDQNFAAHYDDTARAAMQHMRALLDAYAWHKLQPKTDASLVSSALGSGASRVCPMGASDATAAWIYSPGVNITLVRSFFAGAHANVRIRLFNVETGAFTTVSASSPTTGTEAVSVPGNRVVVVDGA